MRYCVLYNPGSGGKGHGKFPAEKLKAILVNDELYFRSMPAVKDFRAFFTEVKDPIIVCGGDGTLSYFLNKIEGISRENSIWYFPTGSGNDFNADLEKPKGQPYCIDNFIEHLSHLKVKGKKYRVFNGAGAGVDGYACAEGERKRRAGKKIINYTLTGAKGLLYDFKPQTTQLEVDGKIMVFENVWLSPIMFGRFFGGGMMVAPDQDRQRKELSVIIASCRSRIRLALLFPKIFNGTHIKNTKIVKIFRGRHIKITLERPTPLQYDGEVINDVSEYEMWLDC